MSPNCNKMGAESKWNNLAWTNNSHLLSSSVLRNQVVDPARARPRTREWSWCPCTVPSSVPTPCPCRSPCAGQPRRYRGTIVWSPWPRSRMPFPATRPRSTQLQRLDAEQEGGRQVDSCSMLLLWYRWWIIEYHEFILVVKIWTKSSAIFTCFDY